MTVTIGIKTLNEERNIEAAIVSALAAVRPFDGEVILADCGSTDRTIEIAKRHPVRIIQLACWADRSCGTGAQLAFQLARGRYFYLLDGDMMLHPDFLSAGIAYLQENPEVAAVGGRVIERNVESEDFAIRANAVSAGGHWRPGYVDRLDCGGLYRADVIRSLGYFADRNLHSFEEFEVGARLTAKGWKLARIDQPAVEHFGHTTNGYRLLIRRIKSGYAGGPGEVLRSAIGQPHLWVVLRRLGHIRNGLGVAIWWVLLAGCLLWQPWLCLPLLVLPVVFLSIRRKSVRLGVFSAFSWNVTAYGLICGFFRTRIPASKPLEYLELTGSPAADTPRRQPGLQQAVAAGAARGA